MSEATVTEARPAAEPLGSVLRGFGSSPVNRAGDLGAAILVTAVAVAVRLARYGQSLWADEMEAVRRYVTAPWRVVLAPGAGQYVPNDHLLYTAMAKACLWAGAGGRLDRPGVVAALVRLPSLVAGSLVPVAAAWPLRRADRRAAGLLALVLAVHPWLVAQSDEARGYAMMTLFGVVATGLLPGGDRRWRVRCGAVAYASAVAAMLYTVAVGGLLVVGHGVWMATGTRRAGFGVWARGAVAGLTVAGVLYLPAAAGIADYGRHPMRTPDDPAGLVADLPAFAAYGRNTGGGAGWGVAVAALGVGTAVGRRRAVARWVGPMAVTTGVAVATAVVWPAAGQVRCVPWGGVWMAAAAVGLLLWAGERFGRTITVVSATATVAGLAWTAVRLPPDQPVREGIAAAERLAPPGEAVVVAFLSAGDAAHFYGGGRARAADSPGEFYRAEAEAVRTTGRRPWVVVSFEDLLGTVSPPTWDYLRANYQAVERLPGRVTAVTVYAPR